MARGGRRDRPRDGTFGARLYDAQTRWIAGAGRGDERDQPFADAIGVSPTTMSPWWKADTPPASFDLIRRIARVTGTDPGWLMFGAECQAPMRKAWPAESSAEPAREASHTPPVSQMRGIPAAEFVAAQKAAQRGRKQAGKKRGA